MNQKYHLLFFLSIIFCLQSCAQKNDTSIKPKKFINEETFNLDLTGKVKAVEWIVIDSVVYGNTGELFKGNFKGTIDSISLKFSDNQIIKNYNIKKNSIRTFEILKQKSKNQKIIYKSENVLLAKYSGTNSENDDYYYFFQDYGYETYISEDNEDELYYGNELISYQYNKYGDIEKMIWNTSKDDEPKETIFKYKYDNNQNWVERIEIRILNDGESYENKKDIRNIVYYE